MYNISFSDLKYTYINEKIEILLIIYVDSINYNNQIFKAIPNRQF